MVICFHDNRGVSVNQSFVLVLDWRFNNVLIKRKERGAKKGSAKPNNKRGEGVKTSLVEMSFRLT